MASVAIILGSVRPGRAGEQVVRWIEDQARQVVTSRTRTWDQARNRVMIHFCVRRAHYAH